ncbi:hypothetical protein [uncultured Methanobrevibacter sp.]
MYSLTLPNQTLGSQPPTTCREKARFAGVCFASIKQILIHNQSSLVE